VELYNRLIKFYKIGSLLEGCFVVLTHIFKIEPWLESLLEMILRLVVMWQLDQLLVIDLYILLDIRTTQWISHE
jgi:hypothetical protein